MNRALAVLLAGTLVVSGLTDSTVMRAKYMRLRITPRPGPHYIEIAWPTGKYVKGKGWLWQRVRFVWPENLPKRKPTEVS